MRKSIIASTIIHLIVIGAAVIWSLGFSRWPRKIDVYQVQLVSMPPPPPKKVTMEESKPKPVPVEKKVPETPVKKPEKVSTKKREVKKEPAKKKEEEKEEIASPGGDKQVKVDTKDFPFAYYLNLLRYRVQENWNPPYQETGEENKINAVVGFQVNRNGKITAMEVETPSGKFLFDQAALRAVAAAGPLPPLPDEYIGEKLTVHIEFEATW